MLLLRLLLLVAPLFFAGPLFAQGTTNRPQNTQSNQRTPIATQPSNNPFQNPIGQGVPPAASAKSNLNGNRTNIAR